MAFGSLKRLVPHGGARPRKALAVAAFLVVLAVAAAAYVLRTPRPPTVTGTSSNQGWIVTFHFDEKATEVEYKAPFSEHFEKIPEGPGGKGSSEVSTGIAALRGRGPFLVRYKGFLGIRRGPYEVVFDADQQAVQAVKRTLGLVPQWITFREHMGRRLCYFSQVLSYKHALQEIRYGINTDPNKQLSFVPSETSGVSASNDRDQIMIDLDDDAAFVTVQLTFVDGSRSDVKSFKVPFAGQPRRSPPGEPRVIAGGARDAMMPIRADDPKHVDVMDLFPQARAAAEKLQPLAALVEIYAEEVTGGSVDTTGVSGASFHFEYLGVDPSKPPGKDQVKVAIRVSAGSGTFWAVETGGAVLLRQSPDGKGLVVPCSSKRAWAAAVRSGVPENAVASFAYRAPWPSRARPVWELDVAGHPELKRRIDGETCEVVK